MFAATAVTLSLIALACSPGGGVPPDASVTPVTDGSTSTSTPVILDRAHDIVIGIGTLGAPRTLNPLLDGPDVAVLDLIAPAVFATAYDVDPESRELVPDVLLTLPSVANGGILDLGDATMEVTLRVAPGAKWSDGTPITPADLVYTYEVATNPALRIRSDVRAAYSEVLPGTIVTDGPALTFTMDAGAHVEQLFTIILPKSDVLGTDFLADWNDRMWLAGGPFEFGSYQPGQFLELRRNENYWKVNGVDGSALPFLDRVIFRFFEPDPVPDLRLRRAFESRDVDVAIFPDARNEVDAYRPFERQGAVVLTSPSSNWEHINFQFGPSNRNEESLNQYVEFRRAIAHAIDREELAAGRSTVIVDSPLGLYLPSLAQPGWARYDFDTERSQQLLAELGGKLDRDLTTGGGPRVVLTASSASATTVAMAGDVVVMLDRAGFAAELQLEDSALFFGTTLDNGNWDLGTWRMNAGPGRERAACFVEMFDPDGLPFVGSNFWRWGTVDSTLQDQATRTYAGIIDAPNRSGDEAEIDRLLTAAEEMLADQVVLIPLIVGGVDGVAVWPDSVAGVTLNPMGSLAWNVDIWRRPAGS